MELEIGNCIRYELLYLGNVVEYLIFSGTAFIYSLLVDVNGYAERPTYMYF